MKRLVYGRTYNTDTSTVLGRYEYENERGDDAVATVYQSRDGLFFIVHAWPETAKGGCPKQRHLFEPTSRAVIERMIRFR